MNLKVELIKLAIQAITLVIVGFLAPAVLSWLNEKSEDARLSRMKDWALKAVKAAEQIYKDYEIRDPDGGKHFLLYLRADDLSSKDGLLGNALRHGRGLKPGRRFLRIHIPVSDWRRPVRCKVQMLHYKQDFDESAGGNEEQIR